MTNNGGRLYFIQTNGWKNCLWEESIYLYISMEKCVSFVKYNMWQQQQQQQQAYLRSLPSQHPQQQTLHPGIMGGTDDRVHQSHQQHHQHHQHHRATIMDLPVPRSGSFSYYEIRSRGVSRWTDMRERECDRDRVSDMIINRASREFR